MLNDSLVLLLSIPRTLTAVILTFVVIVLLSTIAETLAIPALVLFTKASDLPFLVDADELIVPSVVLKFTGVPSGILPSEEVSAP